LRLKPPLPYGFRFAHGFATASRPSRQLTQFFEKKLIF
jgi:hypothetical protein